MRKEDFINDFAGKDFEEIFQQYLPLVYHMKSRYTLHDFEHDDWMQESRIVLHRALEKYKPGNGVTFGLYYKIILENRVKSLLRQQQAKKRIAQRELLSLDQVGLEGEHFVYQQYAEENMYIRELVEIGNFGLSDLEERVLYHYLKEKEFDSIASLLGENRKSVANAFSRAKRKIKDRLIESEEQKNAIKSRKGKVAK